MRNLTVLLFIIIILPAYPFRFLVKIFTIKSTVKNLTVDEISYYKTPKGLKDLMFLVDKKLKKIMPNHVVLVLGLAIYYLLYLIFLK